MGESEFLQRRNNRRRRIRARVCETLSSYARGTEAGAEAGAGGGGGGNSSLSDAAHIRVSVGRRRSSGAVADVDAADNVGGISRRSYCADSVSRGPSASRAENFRTLAVRGRSSDEKFASIGGNWTSRQRRFSLSLSLSLSPPPFLSPTLINQGSHLCPPTMTSSRPGSRGPPPPSRRFRISVNQSCHRASLGCDCRTPRRETVEILGGNAENRVSLPLPFLFPPTNDNAGQLRVIFHRVLSASRDDLHLFGRLHERARRTGRTSGVKRGAKRRAANARKRAQKRGAQPRQAQFRVD